MTGPALEDVVSCPFGYMRRVAAERDTEGAGLDDLRDLYLHDLHLRDLHSEDTCCYRREVPEVEQSGCIGHVGRLPHIVLELPNGLGLRQLAPQRRHVVCLTPQPVAAVEYLVLAICSQN